MKGKGPPRETADWGTPTEKTRSLSEDDNHPLYVGGWYCAEGGWPSPNPKQHTEIFYVLSGYASISDSDGQRHYFGPGDCVVIPKGHTGRWDIYQDIHKLWAVNDHSQIEDTNPVIRVQVDHYNTFGPQYLQPVVLGQEDPLYGSVETTSATTTTTTTTTAYSKTLYDVGPTKVGIWGSEPGSYQIQKGNRAWVHVLEGIVYVSTKDKTHRCVPGDTLALPPNWSGHIDVVETTRQLWTVTEQSKVINR
jgi:uncharacterized cupin superfamily protein